MNNRIPYICHDGRIKMLSQQFFQEKGMFNTLEYERQIRRNNNCASAYASSISGATMSLPSAAPLTENCRNCGAPPEQVCSYCGTAHDGKTYKTRNVKPAPLTDAERKFWLDAQTGIQIHNPYSAGIIKPYLVP